jgi:ribosomal protein L19E
MPRGRPNVAQGADPKTNKMEAVRQALDTLSYDAQPLDIQKFVKDNFNQDMTANMVSSYKSSLRRKAGLKGRRRKRGRSERGETASAAPIAATFHDGVHWKDIRAVKDIAGRIGVKGLRELVELLD